MRIVICLLIAAIPLAYWIGERHGRTGASLVPLGATEVFKLRSECAKLTEHLAHADEPFSFPGSVLSRYDTRTNRCYAEIYSETGRRLYDVQTGEVVAELWNGTPPSGYIKGGPDHPSEEAVRAVIEGAMADDRKP